MIRTTFALALALGAVAGCKGKSEGGGGAAAGGAAAEGAEAASDDGQEAVGAKINPYIKCLNEFSGRVHDNVGYYLSWVGDAKTGPTGKENAVNGIMTLPWPVANCTGEIAKVKGAKPSMPELEQAGEAYSAALTKLEPILQTAHDYYDQKNYKDDAWAKARELHGQIIAAYDGFDVANKALDAQVTKVLDELESKELARLEKQGDAVRIVYLHRKMLASAKLLLHDVEGVKSPLDLADLDLAHFTTQIQAFEASMGELKSYFDTNKAKIEKDHSFAVSWIPQLWEREGLEYLKTAKEMMRRKRDGEKIKPDDWNMRTGHPESQDGHPAKLYAAYNDLVTYSNTVLGKY